MEPTLIMPNANGATKDGAPKPPRHKLFSGRIIWGVLALTVIAFLIIYFVAQKNKVGNAPSDEDIARIMGELEARSVDKVINQEDLENILNTLQQSAGEPVSEERLMEIKNNF